MSDSDDPDRVAAVRRALGRLIDILAKAVAREVARRRGGFGSPDEPTKRPLSGDRHVGKPDE